MQDAPQADPKKLFVGNLSFDTTKDTVESIFSEHGTITDLALITDRMTGRSRGIAFVTFETEDQAQSAIDALNGMEVDGREIIVNVSRPKKPRTGGYNNRRGGYRGGNRNNNDRRGGYNRDDRR